MNLFQKVRGLFGFKTEVEKSPIEILQKAISDRSIIAGQLDQAGAEFDEIYNNFVLKLAACDKLIEKGEDQGTYNKKVLSDKLDRITDEYLENVRTLNDQLSKAEDEVNSLQSDILAKAIDITVNLTDEDQQSIGEIIKSWEETGLIKGEKIDIQAQAIVTAIDIVLIGDIEKAEKEDEVEMSKKEFKEEHEKLVDILESGTEEERKKEAKKQKKELEGEIEKSEKIQSTTLINKSTQFDSDLVGHYANIIVKRTFREQDKDVTKILFLKRAASKVVAPNQYCLPGGHIDEGETLVQAAIRELKEEANLDCNGAYPVGKAKCEDGKWAFYLTSYSSHGDVAILDGESVNACWMCEDEWLEADLIFDLKDHLAAIEIPEQVSIDKIPTIKKAEEYIEEFEKGQFTGTFGKTENEGSRGGKVIGHTKSGKPIYARMGASGYKNFSSKDHQDAAEAHKKQRKMAPGEGHSFGTSGSTSYFWHNKKAKEHEEHSKKTVEKAEEIFPFSEVEIDEIIKGGHVGSEGEIRTWGGIRYQKTAGKWHPVKGDKKKDESNDVEKKHSVEHLTTHAENTSEQSLKKVIGDESKDVHVRDAAKRELERRKAEKDKGKPKPVAAATAQPQAAEQPKPKKKKKPDVVKYTPAETLSSEYSAIEKEFGKHLNKNYERAASKYEKMHGNVLNTDNARELSDAYNKNRAELSAAVHEPSSAFIKKLYADKLAEKTPKGKKNLVYFTAGGTGAGKSVPVTTPIITPNGLQQIGTIKIGDIVFSKDGGETKVAGVFPQGNLDVYKIIFSDGTSALASDDHLWEVTTRYIRMKQASLKEGSWERKSGRNPDKWICNNSLVTTTKIIRENINKLYAIPITKPLQFLEKSYNIDPYLMGMLLGDGCMTSKEGVVFSTKDDELLEWLKKLIPLSCRVAKKSLLDVRCDYAIYGKNTPNKNDLIRLLKAEGLLEHNSYTKYIPEHYLFGSIQQRTALLQGLLDTDGGISGKNVIEYSTSSKHLRDGVLWLVQSLGGVAKVTERIPKYIYKGEKRNGALSYRIRIKLPNDISPFRLTRKAVLLTDRKYLPYRYIKSVEYVGKQECVCIKVDHLSETFLINDAIVTHNTSGLQGTEKAFYDKAHIVFDTNMNTFGSAKSKIDQALNAGKKIRINYTFRDPVDAFENGAVPRSLRIGRTVPIEEHVKTHLGSMDTVLALKEHYKGNKNVHIVVTDNSRGKGNAKDVPISFVKEKEKSYVASELREKLHSINKKLYERGKISESHYKGFRG